MKRSEVLNWKNLVVVFVLSLVLILGSGQAFAAIRSPGEPNAALLATLPEGAYGSTIGPGGDLYVTEPAAGRISRVDPRTGEVTTFASGLPISNIPFGGAVDIAFIGDNAYVLVTLVGSDVGGDDVVGVYKVTGPNSATIVADIGAFSENNLPDYPIDVPTGVQFAMETYRGGFLVTDGHHNRVLRVTRDGAISELMVFGNIVPTGLEVWGKKVLLAEAGPIPHLPQDGKVVALYPNSPVAIELASGAPLLVDVEFNRGRSLYALSQGDFPGGGNPADPAEEYTGELVQVNWGGGFSVVVDGLNRPNSMEFIRNTAYVIGLGGEIWKIGNVASPPYGISR
jgi:hypothetical protein